MIRNSRILTIAGALLVAGATLATAREPRGSGGPGFHGHRGGPGHHAMLGEAGLGPLGHALHRLDLSAEQRDQVRALVDKHRDATESLRASIRDEMRARMESELALAFDEAAVRARAEQHARILVEVEVARARLTSEVLAVLTAEQRTELAEMKARLAERFERFGERRGWDDDAE